MYRFRHVLCMLIVLVLTLSGCSKASYVENQIYAVMLGVDLSDEGTELTIRYPTLSGTSPENSESGGGYSNSTAAGNNLQQAMDNLRAGLPRRLNLAALTMIVISKEYVASDEFKQMLDMLALNYRMYSAAYVSVCEGKARDAIENQDPQLGSRLSEGLQAMVENSFSLSTSVESRFADLYYSLHSAYSDVPVMTCGSTESEGINAESESDTVFTAACVPIAGSQPLELDVNETILLNLLRGDAKRFSYEAGGTEAYLTSEKKPRIEIKLDDTLSISINIKLSATTASESGSISEFADGIKRDIYALISKCAAAGVEPFGFADRSATKFFTMEKWKEYNWTEKFQNAEISVTLKITPSFETG